MDYVNFEQFLKSKNKIEAVHTNQEKKQNTKRLKAEKNASLTDFIEMIAKLVSKSMNKLQVEFCPDEGNRMINDTRKSINHPYICYQIISREPFLELKPRIREVFDENRKGEIHGQLFKCIIQFNIISTTPLVTNDVMDKFEELMYAYQHYFLKNGVKRILFKKHFTDKEYDIFRQTVSVRSLQYYVEIEKLYHIFHSEIEAIETSDLTK